jgi:hypothetical protein
MARQISPIVKLRGNIDDLSFYKTQDGYLARVKTAISADRIKNDPSFDLTRRNAQEFGAGGKAGRVFRNAWNTEIRKASDNRLVGRITQTMVSVLQTDPINDYGSRKVEKGDLTTLDKMEFNLALPFSATVSPEITATIIRATGQVTISLPAYVPEDEIAAPSGASHYNFFAAAAAIDFANEKSITDRVSSADLLWNKVTTAASTLQLTLPANNPLPLFVVLGIGFKKIVNNKLYPMSENECSLRVIAVEPAPPIGL